MRDTELEQHVGDPAELIELKEPIEVVESEVPVELVEPVELVDSKESVELVDPIEPVDPEE